MNKESGPQVAVIIPTYMPGEYVKWCLRALESQTLCKNYFVVYIGLNGPISPYDKFLERELEGVSFNYRLYFLEKAGVSNARNFLLDVSVENYICFIDDDDVVSDNYLESLLAVVSDNDIAISNVKIFNGVISCSVSNYIGRSYARLPNIIESKFRARKYFSSACAKMLSRKVIDGVYFDDNLAKGEDSLFMADLSPRVQSLIKAQPEATYYVFKREGSASRRKSSFLAKLENVGYLIRMYCALLFSGNHDRLFILTRIAASIASLKNIR